MRTILIMTIAVTLAFAATASAVQKTKKPTIKKEHVTFKKFNENNPATAADNTITIIKDKKEVEMPVSETWNEEHLKMFQNKDVNVIYGINPETGSYTVTNIEPFE